MTLPLIPTFIPTPSRFPALVVVPALLPWAYWTLVRFPGGA
jgi:hypothetical protein